jgi:hypothetical protein
MNQTLNRLTQNIWTYAALGLAIGAYCFFHATTDLSLLVTLKHEGGGYWYRIFSETIFKPQTIYIAESILMPLIAKFIGANSTVVSYQVLNAFVTLMIMPVVCVVFKRRIQSIFGVLLAIALWVISYSYLTEYELGFPDPLTIILLALAVGAAGKTSFIFIFLAALSHFSTVAFALLGFLILSIASKLENYNNYESEKYSIYGIVCGKLFLFLWGYFFQYHLNSRINFVYDKGIQYFWNRYLENPVGFWYTPGKLFLIVNLIIFIYFIYKHTFRLCLAQCILLSIAYFSLFITVDGLRVFAVVIAPGYLYLLILFVNDIFKKKKID